MKYWKGKEREEFGTEEREDDWMKTRRNNWYDLYRVKDEKAKREKDLKMGIRKQKNAWGSFYKLSISKIIEYSDRDNLPC